MAEPTQPESGQEPVNKELPTPKFTEPSAASQPSSVDTKAIAKEVAAILKPDFERVAQSTKDKRIAALEKRLGVSDLAELEEQGVQIPENVKLEYRLRNLEQGHPVPERSEQTTTSPGSGASLTAQDVSEVVKQYQLDANQADVIEALRGTYRNRDHFENTLAKLALARVNKPTPTPAETTTMPSTPSAAKLSAGEIDQKWGELGQLLKNPSTNAPKIASLKKQLRDAGETVD